MFASWSLPDLLVQIQCPVFYCHLLHTEICTLGASQIYGPQSCSAQTLLKCSFILNPVPPPPSHGLGHRRPAPPSSSPFPSLNSFPRPAPRSLRVSPDNMSLNPMSEAWATMTGTSPAKDSRPGAGVELGLSYSDNSSQGAHRGRGASVHKEDALQ